MILLQHNAIFSHKSSWRKWPWTPLKISAAGNQLAYYVMEFCREKGNQKVVRAYKARVARLQSPNKAQAECAMNETHALMTKFGNHYLLVLSIYGGWEVRDKAKPRPTALVLVIVCCLNTARRGRAWEWQCEYENVCVFGSSRLRVKVREMLKKNKKLLIVYLGFLDYVKH